MCEEMKLLRPQSNRQKFIFIKIIELTAMNAEQVFVEVRVEPCRINVQDFSLTFQNSENSLNAVQLFTMTQICVDQQIVQHFDQIREEFDVDGVGKPRTIFFKDCVLFINTRNLLGKSFQGTTQ